MSMKLGGLAVALVAVVGCAGNKATSSGTSAASPSAPPVTVAAAVGQYNLVAVDGRSLPYTVPGASRRVVSGSFVLKANGTFELQTAYASDAGGNSAAALSGACYAEGNELKMVWDEGFTNMTVRGDTVLLKRDGALFAYLRSR